MSTRTALFARNQPGGVFTIEDLPQHPGAIWFVGSAVSGASDAAGFGKNPDAPFATIDYAITAYCTANAGDVIYVLPGHSETRTTAITCDIEGISIIGLGNGDDRPQITGGANNIDVVTITADNVTLENLYFNEATVATVNANINIAAANCVLRKIHMDMGANDRVGITITAAGEKPLIEGCSCIVTANGPGAWIDFDGVIDLPVVRNNYIVGSDGANEFDRGVLDFSGVAVTNPIVVGNVFGGADDATPLTAIGDAAAVVGDTYSGNFYGGGTTNADTVSTVTATIGAGAITAASFGAGAIDATAIAANAIGASEIADNAIDAGAIAADAITNVKIADDAIAAENLATGALTADAFAANAIVAATLAAGVITNAKFAAGAIDAAAIANDAIDATAIADGAIDAATFAAGAINAAAIANDAIDNSAIAAGAISAAKFAAGAIDATVIADGAIDASAIAAAAIEADAFAADAITAAAIATGALTADAFAADAIVAATLATGALTADAFAANAIVAATLNADAITNAKIADGALATEQFALSAGEKTLDGIVVTRTTGALPQTTGLALFTVTGHILLKRILGVVTNAIGGVANVTHLRLNSTGAGATTDLCLAAGGTDITGDVADTTYEITGTVGEAMVATTNLPKAPAQLLSLLLVPGSLEVACAGSDGGGGLVRWSVTYVPMEAGAQMVAA